MRDAIAKRGEGVLMPDELPRVQLRQQQRSIMASLLQQDENKFDPVNEA
jgi:hypothetical protein